MKKIIKDYSSQKYTADDEIDFHIKTIDEEKIVNQNKYWEDDDEFNCELYDVGDNDDLPDSDRQMNKKYRKCNK